MKHLRWSALLAALMLLIWGGTLTHAQSGNVWDAVYFNNQTLSGSPVLQRSESAINYNWGVSSPDNGDEVPVDGFSARWTTTAFFNTGRYRFVGQADDGLRIFVDGDLKVDTFDNGNPPGTEAIADVDLGFGDHTIRVEYREAIGSAFISVDWIPLVQAPQGFIVNDNPSDGTWFAQYYDNRTLSGEPIFSLNETTITSNWGTGSPGTGIPVDGFSARWTQTRFFNGGTYRLNVSVDDGIRIVINGNTVVNQFTGGSKVITDNISISGGTNTIVIEYFEDFGPAYLIFSLIPANLAPALQPETSFDPNAYIEVITSRLNVRSSPQITEDNVITLVYLGERYPLLGRTENSLWWQIQLDGNRTGWVSSQYVVPRNTANVNVTGAPPDESAAPAVAVQAPQVPGATGFTLRATANVNIRNGPSAATQRLGILPNNQRADILGRSINGQYWLINYNGIVGWVAGGFIAIPATINLNAIPVL